MLRGVLIEVFAACNILAMGQILPSSLHNATFNTRRFSNDVFQDASLKVPDLIAKYRYPIELHTVITPDGYILELHRIPHGRYKNNVRDIRKPVVFLMHGLLCSSSMWVIMGPDTGLAYILADEGYDVWMGNTRGGTYSRRHTSLNPDAILSTAYWKFSWDEMGNYDLPTMIDHVLQLTGEDRLHYVGHSQGTTAFFVMASLRPEYNQKIISMHALAPVAYMAYNKNPLLLALSPYASNIEKIASWVGIGEFLPHSGIYSWAGEALCRDKVMTQSICSNVLFLLGGWDEEQLNRTMLPVIFGHLPAGSSVRQLAHYAQGISGKEFRRYDLGNILSNKIEYGSFRPPKYDLSRITAPVFLHYSDNDPLAHVFDVDRLYRELGRPMGMFRVPLPTFTHLDFMWAIDAKQLVYNTVIHYIAAMQNNVMHGSF